VIARGLLVAILVLEESAMASALRDRITELACGDHVAREAALTALENAPSGPLGLPDESLVQPATAIHGYVVDRLLEVLGEARLRDPTLSSRIDDLVGSWNFCAITAGEVVWTISTGDGRIERVQESFPSAVGGRGYAAWGLIPRRASGRPAMVATLEANTCEVTLPSTTMAGPLAVARVERGVDLECEGPTVAIAATIPWAAPRLVRSVALPRLPIRTANRIEVQEVVTDSATIAPRTLGLGGALFTRQSLAGKLDAGVLVSVVPRTNTFARVGVTWQLASEFAADARSHPTWSGGLGYDNWRPGTWSLQLNNWGPITAADGKAIASSTVAELGYKVPLGTTLGARLGLKVSLSSRLSGGPTAGVATTVKLPRAVFASVGVAYGLMMSGGPTWTYALGRSTWTPGSLSIILANFGPNKIPQTNLLSRTAITASWSWAW
jgi:hypothetical protein